jgi:hypothetical protein
MTQYNIYLGLATPDGKVISERDARAYVSDYFCVRSYTLISASGVWETAEEGTLIVRVLTDKPSDVRLINSFAEGYCEHFGQQCVLLTATDARVRFIGAPARLEEVI